jgi:hypothetical protein
MGYVKRLTFVLALVCALAPARARADEGGFVEFIWGLDPKLLGPGSEIHLLCRKADGRAVPNCEEMWGLPHLFGRHAPGPTEIGELKHELDFRFAYYREYGTSYEGVSNAHSINAWKLMAVYKYHADLHTAIGLGAGIMPFYGTSSKLDASGHYQHFDAFTRGILTPLSVTYWPATTGDKWKKSFYVRGEASFITQGFSPYDFDNTLPKTETKGEWSVSIATGFDFRRRFLNR